jgi:uncharacterized protein YecT (DUF1311 family)
VRWVVVALLAGAVGGPKPPVIHEPFTALPCPIHPDTSIDVEGCQEVRVLRTDRAIDREVAKIFRLLPPTQGARSKFVDGEQSWLHYRRQSCLAESSRFQGGTAQPVAFLNCSLRRNRSHLAELVAMRKALGTP